MRLIAEQYEKNWVKLVLAVAANVIFLVLLLKIFTPRYEINDDMFISMFIDGQMANKSNYILFCNYFLAAVLRFLYDITSNTYPIYSLFQYAILLLSFISISYVLLCRCNLFVAFATNSCLLGFFAANCYLYITFTKTSGIAVTAGIFLMLYARSRKTEKWEHFTGIALGIGLCLSAIVLRVDIFAAVLAVLFPLGLYELVMYTRNKEKKLRAALSYCMPFLMMLVLAGGLYGANALMWLRNPYREYKEFATQISNIYDYHSELISYDVMPDVYDRMHITPEVCSMMKLYQSFDDTEVWTTEKCLQLLEARNALEKYPGLLEIATTYLGCWKEFFSHSFFGGFALIVLLWLVFAKHDRYKLILLLGQLFCLSCLYFVFIWMDRYMVNRIDIGIFMAFAAGFLWCMEASSPKNWKTGLCLVITTLAIFTCAYQNRLSSPWYPGNQVADYSYSKQQIQSLIDDEHLFLVGDRALNLYLYSPLEPMPAGYRDKLYFSCGWVVRHPQVMEVLADYGLENPYRDAVNNDKVYVIPNDIELTMEYINHYYNENARAELVQELASKLGIDIYRIVA